VSQTTASGTITYSLYLDRNNQYETGKTIKVVYEAPPPELSNDTDDTIVPLAFLIPKAKAYLYQMQMESAPASSTDVYKTMMSWSQQLAEDVRARRAMQHMISHVHYDAEEGGVDLYAVPGVIDRHRPA